MRPASIACFVATVLLLLACGGCPSQSGFEAPDVNIQPPSDKQLEVWKGEAYRHDACRVADYELKMRLDMCQWRAEPFNAAKYTYFEKNEQRPDWGSYVVRGSSDRSGRLWRYRVKLRRSGDVWYAVQVSHYVVVELEHPALESGGPPNPH